MKLKFIEDVATKEAKPQVFKKDQVVDFPDDEAGRASAQHWLNRGKAIDLDAEKEAKAEAAPAPKRAQAMVPNVPEKG